MSQVSVFALLLTFASLFNCHGAPTTRQDVAASPMSSASNSYNPSTLTKDGIPKVRVPAIKRKASKRKFLLPSTLPCKSSDPVLSRSIIGVRRLVSERRYFLQITEDGQVSGIADRTNTSELVLESVGPGLIRIRGKAANLYLSMDSRGKVTAKATPDSKSVFKRIQAADGFIAYRSNKYCRKFIGMKWNGQLKRGYKVNQYHHSTHFVEMAI